MTNGKYQERGISHQIWQVTLTHHLTLRFDFISFSIFLTLIFLLAAFLVAVPFFRCLKQALFWPVCQRADRPMVDDSKPHLPVDRLSTSGQMDPQWPSKSTVPEISGGIFQKQGTTHTQHIFYCTFSNNKHTHLFAPSHKSDTSQESHFNVLYKILLQFLIEGLRMKFIDDLFPPSISSFHLRHSLSTHSYSFPLFFSRR